MPIGAIIGGAAISGAAALGGAAMASDASNKATDAQVQAGRENIAFQKDIFKQQKEALAPWQKSGLAALENINSKLADGSFDLSKYGYDDLVKDPGYQFRLDEGNKAMDAQAARAGKLVSGDQFKDVVAYNSGMASQEFGNAFARTSAERDTQYNILNDQVNRGYYASAALSGVAGQLGDKVSTANTNIGNAQAEGAREQGNIWSGLTTSLAKTANTGIDNYLVYNRLKKNGV